MSYVDTQLIECSRASSEETKGDNMENPAIFTNKLGDNITLEVGDVVSVERSFINGLGSGNQKTIQFKGVEIPQDPPIHSYHPNKYKQIKYTNVVGSDKLTDPRGGGVYRMGYYQSYKTEEVTEEIHLKDNSQVYTIGYYMNANQYPTYIQLPRRFQGLDNNVNVYEFMTGYDSYERGMSAYSVQPDAYVLDDWEERHTEDGTHPAYKQVVDNSRYCLFVRDEANFNSALAGATDNLPVGTEWRLHPLQALYHKYRERKEVNIKKGFNTPDEVAEQFTRQLNKADNPEDFRIVDAQNHTHIATTTMNAETYKPFICANANDITLATYNKYIDENIEDDDVCKYFNQYFYLGVKRPELFELGRVIPQDNSFYADGMKVIREIVKNDPNQWIETNMEYTYENLLYWRNLFEAQKLYPELWEHLDETCYGDQFGAENVPQITSSAFLHMNMWGHSPAKMSANGTTQTSFGSEGMEANANINTIHNKSTLPLFVHYNQANKDVYYQPDAIPQDKYSMGFAKAVRVNGVDYIVFVPYLINDGIPDLLFSEKVGGVDNMGIAVDRMVGYDWNSTAYSSAFIIPYAGYTWRSFMDKGGHFNNYQGVKNWNNYNIPTTTGGVSIIQDISQIYIGANNPLVSFNEITNRFEISRLHTEEHIGNVFDGGDPKGRQVGMPIERNPDESKVVYKLNPWVNMWGYSPTFLPYGFMLQTHFSYPNNNAIDNARDFYLNSNAIKPYSIFDTQGGIYFDDFGVNEREWGKSIWGIMGYSYKQFNSDVDPSNTLKQRVNFENKFALNRPTTNSEIDTTDNKTWVVNEYGTPQYTNQVPTPMVMSDWTGANPNLTYHANQTLYPPITQETSSLVLTAENLSKQMLNPFYTIHSDILSNEKYVGGGDSGIKLPVVGIVDRYGAEGDFYFGNPSDLSFTITKQTQLSHITTSIHDPDGTFAVIDDNSGVIYKILRNKPAPPNVIQDILKGKGK